MDHVQTKREIVAMLSAAGMRPRKRFGQHFLIDGNLMRGLVECAQLDSKDVVLEVGAGTGGLSDLIVGRVRSLIIVEIDRDLFALLGERFEGAEGVILVQGDCLATKHRIMPRIDELIRQSDVVGPGRVKLVANLPYKIATPLVMNLLVDYPAVGRLCFTVQAEVGDRITASPGGRAFGPLSVVSQALCTIKTIGRLPPSAFWPRPGVDSVMLSMDVGESPFGSAGELRGFVKLVRKVFEHRRKTLRSALAYALDAGRLELLQGAFDLTRRPEQVSVDEWIAIHRAVF